jgi:hypothetical protein
MESLSSSVSGLVLVCDTYLEPSFLFLQYLCRACNSPTAVVVWELDMPVHRLPNAWLPASLVVRTVVDCYVADFVEVPPSPTQLTKETVVVVDSITRAVLRHGVAQVMERLLEVRAKVGACSEASS